MIDFSDIQTEQGFLGYLVTKPDAIAGYLDLPIEVFTDKTHVEIFSTMLLYYREGSSFTPKTLAASLPTGWNVDMPKYVWQLAKSTLNLPGEREELCNTLKELYKKRRLHEKLELARDALVKAPTADETVQEILEFMSEVEFGKDRLRVKSVQDIFESVRAEIASPPQAISSGINALDNLMQGGFLRGKSYSISARKKVGKTALLGQIAVNISASGERVLYIALEMGSNQIMHRMLGRSMQENPIAFMTERKNTADFANKFSKAIRSFPDKLRFVDGAGLSFDELKALLTREKNRIDCFVLDYWQLVGGKPKNKSTSEHLDEIAQWLSDFARRNNILNITATQINQEGNTRGSEGIRLAYDMTMVIHKADYSLLPEQEGNGRWIEMTDTRYTPFNDAGDANEPAIYLNPLGVFFYDADMEAYKQCG